MSPINYCMLIILLLILYKLYKLYIIPYSIDSFVTQTGQYIPPWSPLLSHNVSMPIVDPYSCSNFCGPQARCAITNTQCTSDVDCYGCERIG